MTRPSEPTLGFRRIVSRQGVWHVLKVADVGPGAVHRSTLCGRMGACVLVGYKLDKSEWAAAKADYCKGLVEDLADVEGAITCARCEKRVLTARNTANTTRDAELPDLLDQLARIDAILARSDHVCEPSSCDWKRDIRDIREVRGL